jgi:hypothetical protein
LDPTIQPYPTTYNFFVGSSSSIYKELKFSQYNSSEDNYGIGASLTLNMSENTNIIDISNDNNVNILSLIVKIIMMIMMMEDDIGLAQLTGLKIGENYTDDSDILDSNSEIEKL